MMYSESRTQVCNMPMPACYGPPYPGPYPPVYPGAVPYYAPPNNYKYPYQHFNNSGPVDRRFTQNTDNRMRNVPQPPANMPVPPMHMPGPFPPLNGQYNYPPPMPYYPNYGMVPPNAPPTNHFSNVPPPYPPSRGNQKAVRGRNHPYQQKNRKQPQVKTPQYHCESCDKNFYSSSKYDQHVSEHVTCGLEGCTYRAHALIVEKHIAMQHRNGLFSRIVKGYTPEEIQKWILERKKHYPTHEKVVEKRVQKIEMEERGERYVDRRKSSHNQRRNPTDLRNRQKFGHRSKIPGKSITKFGSKVVRTNQVPKNDIPVFVPKKTRLIKTIDDGYEYQRNLPPFRGIAYYLSSRASNDEFEDSDLDLEEHKKDDSVCAERPVITPEHCIVRSSLDLIRGYDSSEDSDNCDESNVTTISEIPSLIEENENDDDDASVIEENKGDEDDDDDSGPEECSFKLPVPSFILGDLAKPTVPSGENDIEINSSPAFNSQSSCPDERVLDVEENNSDSKKSTRKRRRSRTGKSDDDQKPEEEKNNLTKSEPSTKVNLPRRRFRPRTLLEKLLAPEIRHERNVILQCIRYVVKENFFGIGSNTNAGSSST